MAKLIFDYDGTLHNTMKIYKPSFLKAYDYLVSVGKAVPRIFADDEISCWLGYSGAEMWKLFQPDLEPEIREKCRNIIGSEMIRRLDNGEGELFEGAENVLSDLKQKGHTLIFLSNCRIKYQENHTKAFGLDRFFDYFFPAEKYGFIPKYEIFRKFRGYFNGDFIVIGYRFHDIETAVKNNLKSIGCRYGYSSDEALKNADIIINSITELPSAIEKLTK